MYYVVIVDDVSDIAAKILRSNKKFKLSGNIFTKPSLKSKKKLNLMTSSFQNVNI